MSLAVADDSDCKVRTSVRAAILVKIGQIDVTAILDDDCGMNAIHKNVFKRICEQDDDKASYDNAENIELDLTIDGRSIAVVFRVLPNLYADMILGEEFFCSVNAHIHLERRLLNWVYQDELVLTDMLEDVSYFRALSGGSDTSNGEKSSEKVVVEDAKLDQVGTAASEDDGSSKQKKKKKKNRRKKSNKTSKTDDNSSCSSSTTSNDKDLQSSNSDSNKATPKNAKDEVVKIFIAEEHLWDIGSGECLAYYGIYSSQKKISVFKGEVLKRKEKTPMGYSMEALSDAFGEAEKHGIDHLRIIFENESALRLMIDHKKKYDKYGEMEPEENPGGGLYYPDDIINYYTACLGIPRYTSLKFEHIPYGDETYEEMVHLRNLLEKYVTKTPL